jgi:hypothetical protein
MQYTITRATLPLGSPTADWDSPVFRQAETLEVANYPWPDSGHRPVTNARFVYDDEFLGISFRVEDRYIRAVAQKFQDSVCLDSCVEFFVSPLPDSEAYFNFEVNCGGTILVMRIPSPQEREEGKENVDVSDSDGATILVAHSMPHIVEPEITEPTVWTLEYHIPLGLFASYFGSDKPVAGTAWKANVYKCADLTSHPHWGSWAPLDTPGPGFHQPNSFQSFLFA